MSDTIAQSQDSFFSQATPFHRGKVRDTYLIPDDPEKLFVVASDRISIFDFVLGNEVKDKGAILNALNHYWRKQLVLQQLPVPHDLLAAGSFVDDHIPQNWRGNTRLHTHASVVRKLRMLPIESIVRNRLTGTAFKAYQRTGVVCGHKLREGLTDGSLLDFPLFTPTTKAVAGHDEHLNADEVSKKFGHELESLSLQFFHFGRKHLESRGLILVDTKCEFGHAQDQQLTLADEVLTPDSSRFLEQFTDDQRRGTLLPALDKEFVRKWGTSLGIHERDPKNPDDICWVKAQSIPEEILVQTRRIYRYIFFKITGMKLEDYQTDVLRIQEVSRPKLSIEVVVGSESDLSQTEGGMRYLRKLEFDGLISLRVHIISCHRNPEQLRNYAKSVDSQNTVILAGAGLAAQLPGVLHSWLAVFGKGHVPVLGIAFSSESTIHTLAAQLSLEALPGQLVCLGPNNKAFTGSNGFTVAAHTAYAHEFLPRTYAPKPAKIDLQLL